ncbi:MAG: hypothetical protein ABR968_14515 [Bacteroidales bacterium]|jgi:antitoxin component YwqK of YwqJK toxin-antitoxin module
MKKQTLFIACILCASIVNAQNTEYAYIRKASDRYDYLSYSTKKDKEKIANAKINGYISTFKNNKKEYTWEKLSYDNKGNSILSVNYKPNGNIRVQSSFTYSPEGKVLTKSYQDKNGKEFKKVTFAYNKYGNITEESYYKNGKIKSKITSTFDSNRVLESYYYKNGSPDFKTKWIYTYYPDKSKKSSVIYKANGQVKYTWNYDCKPEGLLAGKHKDTTAVCKNEETDKDGNKIVTTLKFNEKGKPYKTVTIVNKDGKTLQNNTYGKNDIPRTKAKFNPVTDACEEFVFYNTKGQEIYKQECSFDDKNNMTASATYHKGKLCNRSEYKYNTENFLTNSTHYKKDNKLQSTFKFDYTVYKN